MGGGGGESWLIERRQTILNRADFHCASYQGTDMVQERGTTAALRHESGIFADLKS